MKHPIKRTLSLLLCLVMAFQLAEPVFAFVQPDAPTAAQAESPVVLRDAAGSEVEPDESWEEVYPYGAFGFDVTAADVSEGEDTVIKVYRTGGTKGKVTAYITYSPLLVPNEDGSTYYGYALSGKDLTIEVEDPLPITEYQAVGKPADPEPCSEKIRKTTDDEGYVLTLDRAAERYQWEILYNGVWCAVGDSDKATLAMDAEYMGEDYDYRCIYTVDGVRYCTDSLKGESYEKPAPEEPAEAPDDIELSPEPTFTALALDDGEDPYSGWIFGVTFAEGEWQKEIRIHANTDDLSESEEGATIRIAYTDGGEIYSGADTLLYHVADMNESNPSTVGFSVGAVEADKSEGTVQIPVRREGAVERPVSVAYRTVDGTAKAGTDYVAASGTLMLYGNITELPVKVELIDTEGASDEALDFTVELYELKGDDNCTLTGASAAVSLTDSSAEQSAGNLATLLYDGEAVDVTDAVADSPTAANAGSGTVVGEQVELEEPEQAKAELIAEDGAELSTQVYAFPDKAILDFGTTGKDYWSNSEDYAQMDLFDTAKNLTKVAGGKTLQVDIGNRVESGLDYSDHVRYSPETENPYTTTNSGFAVYGKNEGWIGIDSDHANPLGQKFGHFDAAIKTIYAHDKTYDAGGKYLASWLVPKLWIFYKQGNDTKTIFDEPRDTRREVDSKGNTVGYFKAAGAANWNVVGKSSGEGTGSYNNPYEKKNYSGDINTTGPVEVRINFPYYSYAEDEHDILNHNTLLELQKLVLTRRKFQKEAFSIEISTPNDDNTSPEGCMKISDYKDYYPDVSIVEKKGGSADNQVYVGSSIQIKLNKDQPAGFLIPKVEVYYSTDTGTEKNWKAFDKFNLNYDSTLESCTIELLGKKGNELSKDEIEKGFFKFRIVYQRDQKVKLDLTPSLPRDDSGNVQTDQIDQLFNNYTPMKAHYIDAGNGAQYIELVPGEPTQDHCFGGARITYGYSTYNAETKDFDSKIAKVEGIVPQKNEVQIDAASNAASWFLPTSSDAHSDHSVTNIQWVEFGLDKNDRLVFNGRGYPGDARIYFTEADLAGDISIKYYHSAYKTFINAMTTDISWMKLYLDGNGNGRIDGTFKDSNGAFVLDDTSGDKFIRNLRTGESFNELEVEPVKLENGQFGQYFIQTCYTMTPRCLEVPSGADKNEKAQVLGAVTTSLNQGAPGYSELKREQRKYNYVISGKDKNEKYTSDDHPMYEEIASAKTLLSIPLGGDQNPVRRETVKGEVKYVWTPDWCGNNLYSYEHPELIKITNSLAGPTDVTDGAELNDDTQQYDYTADGLKQMNGYLASMTGASTFVLVSQIQQAGTDVIRKDPGKYPVVPDSITMSRVSTTPDASYLSQNDGGGGSEVELPTSGGESELPEFSMPFDLNLGGNEIGVTDYVTIILDENQVGFAISVPLVGWEKEGNAKDGWDEGKGKNPKTANQDVVESFKNFFKDMEGGNKKLGDDTLGNSLGKDDQGHEKPGVKSGKFSVQLSVCTAFLWQYNPLDNGYYFSAWQIGVEGELGFRGQIRLTPCPAFYGFLDVKFSIGLKTGLGVIRDTLHDDAILDPNAADDRAKAVKKHHYAEAKELDESDYNALSKTEKAKYTKLSSGRYAIEEEALARKDFFLTTEQYNLLSVKDRADYIAPAQGERYYHHKKYGSEAEAKRAMAADMTYQFDLATKAFDITFKGKLYMEVQQQDSKGKWVKADKESGYVSGIISSDGISDTLVVIRQQDEMELKKPVRIVLRAMDHDENTGVDETVITYLAPVRDIYNNVHWNGIELSPELNIEIGGGVGVELLKAEIFLHICLGAEFLLWGYNEQYNPSIPEYLDEEKEKPNPLYMDEYYCRVESFNFTIGLAFRIVLICYTYEMDLVSYQINYEANGLSVSDAGDLFRDGEWTYAWHFLNDTVDSIETRDAEDDPYDGVTIRMPQNRFRTQKVYSPEDNEDAEMSTQAFDPTDRNVPFQTSGFGSSMDAARLTTDIPDGSQYKVIRAGEKNYIVYTLSRPDETAAPEDSTMLVLSELGYNGSSYGLVNPTGKGNENYILLDTEAVDTGDLDFDVWADGSTIHAAWVSYASPAPAPTELPDKPDGKPYSSGGKTINADNYNDFASIPEAEEWYRYYRALDTYSAFVQLRAKEAAENTVVKTASWSPAVKSFSAPVEINKNADYKYVFQPASCGDGTAVFFGSTAQGDDGYKALDAYTDYLNTKTLDKKIKNYLTATKSSTLDVLGTRSALNLAVKKDSGWIVSQQVLPENQTLANVEFAPARDGAYYVAYTTEQVEYLDNDMVTVYRLYLRRVKEKDGAIVWGNPFLIRELRDFDQNKGGTDGVYSGGSLMEGKDYNAPYLSNLKFLTANLDADILTSSGTGEALSTQAVKEQTLLSFEMNGASYLIPEQTLESITGGKSGLIYPFFTPPMHVNQDGSLVQEASSGKLQVDINADDNHNLYAVYIGAVEGTSSNALYLSTYDADVGEWGDGTMLAMHDMNTHEAAVRSDLDLNETELAFLYRSDELSAQEEALTAMYGKEALHTVQEIKAKEDADKERKGSNLGDGQTFNFASVQTVKGANDGELLAVTQGATRTMSINSYVDEHGDKQFVLGPKYDENGMVSTQGTYVVSFGQGSADLGEGVIYFGQQDFGAGTRLNVTVNAENVGTTAFRGSDDQPITATLRVGGQVLAEWKIRENVISGQGLSLSGECNPLDSTLRSGNTFTLTLSEYVDESGDSPYNGISKNLDLFTVQDKPDLSVENLTITPAAINDNGACTTADVSFVAANQGAAMAENVYAQFSYVYKYDKAGEPVYKPLPLTKSSLKIGAQESLNDLLSTQDVGDFAEKGIVYLYSDDGTGTQSNSNIRPGFGKRVSGTIQVPAAVFCADESRHAQIKVELFSSASATTVSNVDAITAKHDECYSANNAAEVQMEAFTSFSAAHSIVIPLGTTTRVPVSAMNVRNTKPVLSLDEVGDEDGQNIGILNFKQSKAAGGTVSGAISITPIATGSGALHVTDTDTNTTYSIAFVVTDAENGIDIYRDNEAFTFFNKDGSRYDQNAPNPANQNWGFSEETSWGEGEAKERPMRDNLATGDAGAYFIFDSLAESIDLYFAGNVTVTSTNPAFAKANNGESSVTVTGYGGSIPKTIMLGENPNNDSFRVVVSVNKKRAVFDRLTEHYSGNIVPIPEYDGTSPLLIWSRSFPATGSVTGGSIPLKLYILDNNGLASLNVNNHIMDPEFDSALTSLDANQLLWCYDFGRIDANGTYDITATDISGNITSTTLAVDWFLASGSDPNNTVPVPPYSAQFCRNGAELTGTIQSTDGLEIRFRKDSSDPDAPKQTGNTFEVYYFDGTGFNKMGTTDVASFPVSKNGIYWARVINTGTASGTVDDTWVSQVINLTQIGDKVLQAALSYNGSLRNPVLNWSAGRDASDAPLVKTVTINGYSATNKTGTSLQGQLPIRFNGVYELHVEDDSNPPQTAGQTVTVTDMELTGTERLVSAHVHTKDNDLRGTIEVNAEMLIGGRYDSANSMPADNSYFGKYKVLMLPPENTDAPEQILAAPASSYDWIPLEKGSYTHAWQDLALGTYRLLFVDCGDGAMKADDGAQPNYLLETVTLSDSSQLDDPFRFDDVKDESKFYFDAVYWAYGHKPQITNGMDEIHFEPNTGCTRGQVVTFLWRAAGCPEPENGKTGFTDLKSGGFYVKAVAWAVENGITNGMTKTTFAPDATCTRGQIVTFLWRFRGQEEPKSAKTDFTDVPDSAYYAKAVAWAVEKGVTNGMTKTTFAPNNTCTRGQVVTFLYRAMGGK